MLYIFYFRSCKAVLLKMVFATQQYDSIIRNKELFFYNVKLFFSKY